MSTIRCDICGCPVSQKSAFIQCAACAATSSTLQDCSACHHLEDLQDSQARIKQLEAQLETAKGLLSALNLEDDDAAWEHLQESPDAK